MTLFFVKKKQYLLDLTDKTSLEIYRAINIDIITGLFKRILPSDGNSGLASVWLPSKSKCDLQMVCCEWVMEDMRDGLHLPCGILILLKWRQTYPVTTNLQTNKTINFIYFFESWILTNPYNKPFKWTWRGAKVLFLHCSSQILPGSPFSMLKVTRLSRS